MEIWGIQPNIIVVSIIQKLMNTTILEKPDFKTVRLSTKNYGRITKFGKYQETMDQIVDRILNQFENTELGNPETKNN